MGHFFCPACRQRHRKDGQTPQFRQCVGPKIPQRPKQSGKSGGVQRRPAQGSHDHKAPGLPLRPAQQKGEGGGDDGGGVQCIQRRGDPGKAGAEGPQEVVQHAGPHPQQDGLGEEQQLPLGRRHPNRRPKKPPLLMAGSS